MNRYVLVGLFGLMALATPAARAQALYGRYARPVIPVDPRLGLLYGYGPQRPGFGVPGGFSGYSPYGPGAAVALDPGLQSGSTALSQARQAGQGLADPGSPNVTGHPTRFAAYGGYFNSQGGGGSGPTTAAAVRIPSAASSTPSGGGAGSTPAGTPPVKGKNGTVGATRTPKR